MSKKPTFDLQGVVPIVPTPFTADEEIDFEAHARCIDFAADAGLSGVCLPAYSSEFYKLSDAERARVVESAISVARGRIKIVAQANHPSSKIAAGLARQYAELGADVISFALPRIFALKEEDLYGYAREICEAVRLPVLIQDFNPGGPTVGAEFARKLSAVCSNFRYLKLEESLMGPKIRSIIKATAGRIGVLEGWGGMYLLDLVPAGICGLMPALGTADLLQQVWHLAHAGKDAEALALFQIVLPQVVFGLQNSELYHWIDKRLLAQRGVLPWTSTNVRRATFMPDDAALAYGDRLNSELVAAAERLGLQVGNA
jgi:4-hydroxy-tetrahydrodipicolinate synthase